MNLEVVGDAYGHRLNYLPKNRPPLATAPSYDSLFETIAGRCFSGGEFNRIRSQQGDRQV